jgi:hypothetical protein
MPIGVENMPLSTMAVSQYPPPSIPTLFADGALNFSNGVQVVKFYLFRFDPPLNAIGSNQAQAFAQVAMPMAGFVQTAAFFQAAIRALVAQGTLSEADWKAAEDGNKGFTFNV